MHVLSVSAWKVAGHSYPLFCVCWIPSCFCLLVAVQVVMMLVLFLFLVEDYNYGGRERNAHSIRMTKTTTKYERRRSGIRNSAAAAINSKRTKWSKYLVQSEYGRGKSILRGAYTAR